MKIDVADNVTGESLAAAYSDGVRKFAQLSQRGYGGVGSTVRRKNCTAAQVNGPNASHLALAVAAETGGSPELKPFG